MNPDAFMNWLSGRMSDGRKDLVDKTFDRLDTDGGGQLVLDRVRALYAQHQRFLLQPMGRRFYALWHHALHPTMRLVW